MTEMVIVPAAPEDVVLAPTLIAVIAPTTVLTVLIAPAASVTALVDVPSIAVAPVSVTTQGTLARNTALWMVSGKAAMIALADCPLAGTTPDNDQEVSAVLVVPVSPRIPSGVTTD